MKKEEVCYQSQVTFSLACIHKLGNEDGLLCEHPFISCWDTDTLTLYWTMISLIL